MRLIIDVPEWAQERHIYIMAGIELLACKFYGEDIIHIKEERCNLCGKCCKNIRGGFHEDRDENNNCVHLKKEGEVYICSKAISRSFLCCRADPVLLKWTDGSFCSITYRHEEVK